MNAIVKLITIFDSFSAYPRIPELDLALVISATATRSADNFEKMKQIVNSIVERYGTFNISYSVLVFGRTPTVHLRFGRSFPDDKSLQRSINNVAKNSGASLDNALQEAKKVLETSPRKQAKKV